MIKQESLKPRNLKEIAWKLFLTLVPASVLIPILGACSPTSTENFTEVDRANVIIVPNPDSTATPYGLLITPDPGTLNPDRLTPNPNSTATQEYPHITPVDLPAPDDEPASTADGQ